VSVFVCQLEFPGVPKAVQSFRYTRTGRKYQPGDVMSWKAYIDTMAREQYQCQVIPADVALEMDVIFEFAIPKSAKKADRVAVGEGKLIPKTTKPDTDNLIKGLADALAGIVYQRDQQVFQLSARKWLSYRNMTTVIVRKWL